MTSRGLLRLRQATARPLLVVYSENDDAWRVEAPETTASTLTKFWNAAEHRRRKSIP